MTYQNAESFLKYHSSIRRRTKRVISHIPPEKIEWRPKEGRYSFGDQIRHIAATERFMFIETVQKKPSLYKGCGPALASGFERVITFMDELHQESLDIISKLSPTAFQSTCLTPANTELAVWKWLRAMIEHEIHHRSQIYVYLGLLDIKVPQLYGLSAEELERLAQK